MRILVDSSTLIALAKIGELDLLKEFFGECRAKFIISSW